MDPKEKIPATPPAISSAVPTVPSTIPSIIPSTTPAVPPTIGGRIKVLRQKRGISQAVLADSIGVDKSAVSRWETDDREPDRWATRKLADYFQVSPRYIDYGPEGQREPEILDMAGLTYFQINLVRQLVDALRGF